MPTYCYKCPSCGFREEAVLAMSSHADAYHCSNCSKATQRDFAAERAGVPRPEPMLAALSTTREKPMAERVRSGEFKLYKSACDEGLL